jgi:anti-sigma B factor antagonist
MNVTCERSDGVLWLQVSGRINILNATQFEEEVENAIEDGDRAVVLDLENLTYISSAGLYVVLKIAKITWQRDLAFALCGLSDVVHPVFERVGFDKIMAIHPTRAEALASVTS